MQWMQWMQWMQRMQRMQRMQWMQRLGQGVVSVTSERARLSVSGPIRTRPATTLSDWITFPRKSVYGRDSLWPPPLDSELASIIDPRRNPYFRHAAGIPLLAFDKRGAVVGRVYAHVDHAYNVYHGERVVWFGFFECLNDPAVARALLDAVAAFGRRWDCDRLSGPMSLTYWREMGALVDGFEHEPSTDLTYTASYYPALFEASGLTAVYPMETTRVEDARALDLTGKVDELRRAHPELRDVQIRSVQRRDADREIDTLRDLINSSYRDAPYVTPLAREEYRGIVFPLLPFLDPALVLIAEQLGVPIGCIIGVPDTAAALRRIRGRSDLLALWRLRRAAKRRRGAVMTLAAVIPRARGAGVGRLLILELARVAKKRGYRRLTLSWAAEENRRIIGAYTPLGATPLQHLAMFEQSLAPNDAAPS
jgi:GNAT superfamily N-acetyltransferase